MKRIFTLLVAGLLLAVCQPAANAQQLSQEEVDEMLRQYGATDEYFEMQRLMDEIAEKSEAAERQEKTTRAVMLILSLAVAVIPLWGIGKRIIQHPEVRTAKGVTLALLIGVAGGAVLFAINYGWMFLRVKYGDELNFPLALLITVGIAAGAIFLMNKKDEKDS
ncbi:MAG: hypothetical protein IKG92_01225 [Bacteroidales bacterium]|nr:hypothetical protein [Bacteroidales bacterium]